MYDGQDPSDNKGAKKGINTKGGAERRQRHLVSLRHKARDDAIKHVRAEHEDGEGAAGYAVDGSGGINDVWAFDSKSPPSSVPVELLPMFAQLILQGQTREEVFQGTLMIRKLLSVEREPPYTAVINMGVVPKMIEFLTRDDYPELQFEAAWALTNVAAGTSENTMMLLANGAIPHFINLMNSPSADCRDQSAWAIGNIAGESSDCRNAVIDCGAIPALLTLLNSPNQPVNVVRNATWAVSNLCRGKPAPPLEAVSIALPTLANLINHTDEQLVLDAAWGISYISDGPEERVQCVIESGVVPRIVQLLSAPTTVIQMPAIRTVGNIAAGTDDQTQMVINAGALPPMCQLLLNKKRAVRKETCWTISNVAAGKCEQIEALIAANVFTPLLSCLGATELDVRKEAVWSVANVTFCGSVDQVKYLVNIGVIPPLCETLRIFDAKIVTVALEALQCFLQTGENEMQQGNTDGNIVAQQVMECGGVDHLEQLQTHSDADVYHITIQLLETYFATDMEMGDLQDQVDFGDNVSSNAPAGGFEF